MNLSDTSRRNLVFAARVIGTLWALFWLWFSVASALGEELRLGGFLMHIAFPGILFLGVALLAWRWPQHGALVFVTIGLIVIVGYPLMMSHMPFHTIFFVELTMGLPPLLAGLFLYLAYRQPVTEPGS